MFTYIGAPEPHGARARGGSYLNGIWVLGEGVGEVGAGAGAVGGVGECGCWGGDVAGCLFSFYLACGLIE